MASTKNIQVESTDGTMITVNIPVGSMDEPTEAGKAFLDSVESPEGWKFPTSVFITPDKDNAEDCAYAMDWYLGGHETTAVTTTGGWIVYHVFSRGYYHYIGS